jgi:hypothetical protein
MKSITLQYPIKIDGQEIKQLSMRRAKVRDQKIASQQGSSADQEIALFSNLCEVTPATIEELDMADYTNLQGLYQTFFPKS